MAREAQGSVAHRMGTAKLSHLTLLIALEVNTVNKLRPREFHLTVVELGLEPRQAGCRTFALNHHAPFLKEAKNIDSGASLLGIQIPPLSPFGCVTLIK